MICAWALVSGTRARAAADDGCTDAAMTRSDHHTQVCHRVRASEYKRTSFFGQPLHCSFPSFFHHRYRSSSCVMRTSPRTASRIPERRIRSCTLTAQPLPALVDRSCPRPTDVLHDRPPSHDLHCNVSLALGLCGTTAKYGSRLQTEWTLSQLQRPGSP